MDHNIKDDCIFCQIASHKAEARVVFENEDVIAFRDIHPEEATHVLVVPKWHVEKLSDMHENRAGAHLVIDGVIETIKKLGLESGAHVRTLNGKGAGQDVPHLHFHILSKEKTD